MSADELTHLRAQLERAKARLDSRRAQEAIDGGDPTLTRWAAEDVEHWAAKIAELEACPCTTPTAAEVLDLMATLRAGYAMALAAEFERGLEAAATRIESRVTSEQITHNRSFVTTVRERTEYAVSVLLDESVRIRALKADAKGEGQ